jgi:putative N-acetylmannosamine-6-phosphate epimerase
MKRFSILLALVATMALAVVSTGAAQPNQRGLVNVAVVDNTIQIPIGIAANVCGVTVNLLSTAT